MFLGWWPFIDGHHLAKGVDLHQIFQNLDAERAFNVIDNLIVEDAVENARLEGALFDTRTKLTKAYGKIDSDGTDDISGDPYAGMGQIDTPQTEEGYLGLEAPLG